MLRSLDLLASLLVIGLIAGVLLTFAIRFASGSKPEYARIDRTGGSRILGRRVMDIGYWMLLPIGRGLCAVGATPNTVSFISLGLGVVSAVAVGDGLFGIACLFGAFSGLLDTVDGMVASMRGMASDAGEVLDSTVDLYTQMLYLGGLMVFWRQHVALQLAALLALMGSIMVTYSTAKAETLGITLPKGIMRRHERAIYLLVGAMVAGITLPTVEARLGDWRVGIPEVVAVVVVGILANLAAIGRLRLLAVRSRTRDADGATA